MFLVEHIGTVPATVPYTVTETYSLGIVRQTMGLLDSVYCITYLVTRVVYTISKAALRVRMNPAGDVLERDRLSSIAGGGACVVKWSDVHKQSVITLFRVALHW